MDANISEDQINKLLESKSFESATFTRKQLIAYRDQEREVGRRGAEKAGSLLPDDLAAIEAAAAALENSADRHRKKDRPVLERMHQNHADKLRAIVTAQGGDHVE